MVIPWRDQQGPQEAEAGTSSCHQQTSPNTSVFIGPALQITHEVGLPPSSAAGGRVTDCTKRAWGEGTKVLQPQEYLTNKTGWGQRCANISNWEEEVRAENCTGRDSPVAAHLPWETEMHILHSFF